MLSPKYLERLEKFRNRSLALKGEDRIVTAKMPEQRVFIPRRDSGDDYEAELKLYNQSKAKK